MIFDLIFGIFVLGWIGMNDTTPNVERAGSPAPETGLLPDAPYALTDMATYQLACRAMPDPTPVLRMMMDGGMIYPEDRVDFESFSCFAIPDGLSLAGLEANVVCGGVTDPAINEANGDLYPPNSMIDDDQRYQILAFGSTQSLEELRAWHRSVIGPTKDEPLPEHLMGIADGLYTPPPSMAEIYCDDILAAELSSYANSLHGSAEAADWVSQPPDPADNPVDEETGLPLPPLPVAPAQ